MRVCVCVCACMRVCVCACMRVCVCDISKQSRSTVEPVVECKGRPHGNKVVEGDIVGVRDGVDDGCREGE